MLLTNLTRSRSRYGSGFINALARESKISPATISRILSGKISKPGYETVTTLVAACDALMIRKGFRKAAGKTKTNGKVKG